VDVDTVIVKIQLRDKIPNILVACQQNFFELGQDEICVNYKKSYQIIVKYMFMPLTSKEFQLLNTRFLLLSTNGRFGKSTTKATLLADLNM